MSTHPHNPEASNARERLERGENVTKSELEKLGEAVKNMTDPKELAKLKDSITKYARDKMDQLRQNKDVDDALKMLDRNVQTATQAITGHAENTFGTNPKGIAETTVARAKALGYEQWKQLQDPKNSTTTKVLSVLGFMAAGYGVYRLAKWTVAHEGDSFLWRTLKIIGVTGLAAYLVNLLGKESQAKAARSNTVSV